MARWGRVQVRSDIQQSVNEVQARFDSFRDDFTAGGRPAPFASIPLTALPVGAPTPGNEVTLLTDLVS